MSSQSVLFESHNVLQLHQDGVLLQIKSQQDSIADPQTISGEVGLGLVWLQAAQGGELRHAYRNFHDRVCALLTKIIPEQTASKECAAKCQWAVSNTAQVG